MPKLTKRIVDVAQAEGGKDRFLWDAEVKGFGLKVTAAGSKSYVLQYRNAEGRPRRYKIGAHGSPWTCDEARGKAVEILRGLSAGVDPLEAKAAVRTAETVADLVEMYLAEGPADRPNKKARSWELDRGNLTRHVVPLIGRKPIKSLTSDDVAKVQADVAAGRTAVDEKTGKHGRARVTGGKGTAARTVATISAMLSFAVRRKLIPVNPALGVVKFIGAKAERFLTERELGALMDGLTALEDDGGINAEMAAAIRLLALTACRKSEITGLRWDWIDFDGGCLRLPDSKTGAKVVPLASAALELLRELDPPDRTSPFVLPSTKTEGHIVGLQKAWVAVKEHATAMARDAAIASGKPVGRAPNFTGLRLHDLRHSFASIAVSNGVPLFVIGKVLGHKQASTTEIYAHLHDDPLRTATDSTGARIAGMMRPRRTRVVEGAS